MTWMSGARRHCPAVVTDTERDMSKELNTRDREGRCEQSWGMRGTFSEGRGQASGTGGPVLCNQGLVLMCLTLQRSSALCCAQACPTLHDPMECSPPGSWVHGIAQARILEWVAVSSSIQHS